MIRIIVFFNSAYKHGFCNHWQNKKLFNLFQYWKIRCGQLRSWGDTCPFQSPSIKNPAQCKKKENREFKSTEMSWVRMMKVLFSSWKRKISTQGTLPQQESIPWFPPNLPPTSAGWIGTEASCRVQQDRHWKLQWCSSSFAFLSRQNCFFFFFPFSFLAIFFSPFLSFSGIPM